jgi:hypothetical protein
VITAEMKADPVLRSFATGWHISRYGHNHAKRVSGDILTIVFDERWNEYRWHVRTSAGGILKSESTYPTIPAAKTALFRHYEHYLRGNHDHAAQH